MMFPTDYNTEIGWVWNPFTAEYSEEFLLALKEKRTSRARAKNDAWFNDWFGF